MKNYAYCLTINNPTESDFLLSADKGAEDQLALVWDTKTGDQSYSKKHAHERYSALKNYGIDYLLIGTEYGRKGTKHFQMVVVFNVQKTLGQVKKIWPRAHIEYMKGTLKEATDYVVKNKDKPNPKYKRVYIGKIEDIERRVKMDKEYRKVIEDSQGAITELANRTAKIEQTMDEILGLLKEQRTSI